MAAADTIARLQRELATQQTTVDALMTGFQPADFPKVAGLVFDVLYQPAGTIAELGGDWYDIFLLPDGRTAFTIGDVCGRGLAAAVKMAQAKQAIKVAASLQVIESAPVAVLKEANKVIFLNDHNVEFTTALYGIIDTVKRTVAYASAGHHPPVLAAPGQASRIMPNHGFALGVELEMPDLINEHRFSYEAGMLLVLYTDGLIESTHDTDEGESKLLRASRDAVDTSVPHPARFIVETVLRGTSPHPDDVAVLTISFR